MRKVTKLFLRTAGYLSHLEKSTEKKESLEQSSSSHYSETDNHEDYSDITAEPDSNSILDQ